MSAAPDDSFVLPDWWGNVVWRVRAAFLIFALAALALTLPPQVHDMLADLADGVDGSAAAWAAAAKYHVTMILMAVGLWYWARAVLLAWHRVPDSAEGRGRFETALRATGDSDHLRALKAFDLVPRLLCFGTALAAAIGTARSEKWIQTVIVVLWALALYLFLTCRMRLHLGRGQAPIASRDAGRWWPERIWHRLLELLDYAPFGRWVAAISLALGVGLFLGSAATAFIPHSIDWKTAFAHWLPGPSVALFLLGMAVAPLSAITYTVDRATRSLDLYVVTYDGQGFEVPLNWSLSDRVADYIWRGDNQGSMGQCGNQAELANLDAALKAPANAWAPEQGQRRARPIMRCIRGKAPDKGKVVAGKVDALKLAGSGAAN